MPASPPSCAGKLAPEPGLEKETQDGLICPSCEKFPPILGFVIIAKASGCPGWFARASSLPKNNALGEALPHKTGQESGDLGPD